MKNYIFMRTAVILVLLFISGCGTIMTRSYNDHRVYAAVRYDISTAGLGGKGDHFNPFSVLDLPFSVIVDTLCLPFDVIDSYKLSKVPRENHIDLKSVNTNSTASK